MHLRSLRFFALLAICGSFAGAAVFHKTDDTTVIGELQSIAAGKVEVHTKEGYVTIPLDDIGQITLKEPPAPVVAKPAAPVAVNDDADDGPNLGAALFGSLFGGGTHTHSQPTPAPDVVATPATAPTTVPTNAENKIIAPPLAKFTLTNGDQFFAALGQWTDQKLQLQLTLGYPLELPSSTITQIWFNAQPLQSKAKALTIEPGPEDVVFVVKDDDVITVKGLARGIDGQSLQFRYADQDRKINLAKVVGILLRSNPPAPVAGFHQVIHTDTGEQFAGELISLDKTSIRLTAFDTAFKIGESSITTIDFINGKVTSLCDLKPTRVEQAAYFGRLMNYQIDKSLTGGPLVLSDGPATRGIAVHSRCVLQYDLPAGIDRFKTKLGFAQPEGLAGRVEARVLADGKPLYENPDARGDQPPIEIDVPVTGAHTLTLEIDFGKDQDVGDRVVWANPRLLRGK